MPSTPKTVKINASIAPAIAPGTPSPLQLTSPPQIRGTDGRDTLGPLLSQAIAKDLDNIRGVFNALHTALQTPPNMRELLLVDSATGEIVAGVGNIVYQGVRYVNFFSELHVGNSLQTRDPAQAVFNANTDGSVSIGQNGWLDVHDPFEGNAAWIGTQFDTLQITGAVNNGAGLIRLTVPNHTLATGNTPQVRNMQLAGVPNATGTWPVTVIDSNTIDLQGSVWAGQFVMPTPPAGINTAAPTIDRILQVTAVTNNGGLVELQTAVAHLYETGDVVTLPDLPDTPGQPDINEWTITVLDSTRFTLNNSTFGSSFSVVKTCLRFFAGMLAQQIAIGPSFPGYLLRGFADGSLKIRNAIILLTQGASKILIDPSVPEIALNSAAGSITLNAATSQILLTNSANAASIVIDATVPKIQLFDSTGALSVTIDSNGTVTARTFNPGTATFTGVATVRNAAGTGTSSFDIVNGFVQNFTP